MLVLSRKLGEGIVVPGHELEIRVLEIRGNKVRLGITAPRETEVYREEIWEKIHTTGQTVGPENTPGCQEAEFVSPGHNRG